MARIHSNVQTSSAEFRSFYTHNKKLAVELHEKQRAARSDRPQKDIDRLVNHGKWMPRDRIDKLLDPGTPLLEFSTLAATMAYDGDAPGAGCITGIGMVQGREVIIHANDSTIKGGAWYPLTVKKIVRCLDIAIENRLPVIHLCDSAGGFLPLQSEIFPDKYMAGRMFAINASCPNSTSSNSPWYSDIAPPAAQQSPLRSGIGVQWLRSIEPYGCGTNSWQSLATASAHNCW